MKIVYTKRFRKDTLEMEKYISNDQTVSNIVGTIKERALDLKIFPRRYKVWKNTDYRFFLVKGYLVFYRYDESAEKIIVERVIHSRRDVDNEL